MRKFKKANYRTKINLLPSHVLNEFFSTKKTGEELKTYIAETTRKLSHKETVNHILNFIKTNNISKEDMKVFNKILGDYKILNKLQICYDGSYTNGRIFYKNFFGYSNNHISIDGEYWMEQYRKNHISTDSISALNYMKNNFEVIYLHLVSDKEALRDKEFSDMMDDILYDCLEDYQDYVDYQDYEECNEYVV